MTRSTLCIFNFRNFKLHRSLYMQAACIVLVLPLLIGTPTTVYSQASKPNPTPVSSAKTNVAKSAMPAAEASSKATSPVAIDNPTYTVQLRDLERRINDLKEQIRRSHTRLSLLSESVLSGVTAASRAELLFSNEMSIAYRLKRIVAVYDGSPIATKTDERDQIGDQKEIPLYSELVQPGDHVIQILVEYQGTGLGIFPYQKGYKFEVRSSRSFTAVEGKTLALRVIGYEQGGPTTPFHERPAVRYAEKAVVGVGGSAPKASEGK